MISIVIPTFNSEKSIEKLCETIIDELDMEFEIILINDDCSLTEVEDTEEEEEQ